MAKESRCIAGRVLADQASLQCLSSLEREFRLKLLSTPYRRFAAYPCRKHPLKSNGYVVTNNCSGLLASVCSRCQLMRS